jgi:hypothetical protein
MIKKEQKNPDENGKPKTDLFENRPSVSFRFIKNRSVSVLVLVSRRALNNTSCPTTQVCRESHFPTLLNTGLPGRDSNPKGSITLVMCRLDVQYYRLLIHEYGGGAEGWGGEGVNG